MNITINDLQAPNSAGYHAPGRGVGGEDQETEPGTASGQAWDLEAFSLNGSKLKIYSGYNLLAGEKPYGLGDLFIDVDGNANWMPGADNHISGTTDNSKFHYDYVVHWNARSGTSIGTGTYDIYKIADNASVKFKETVFKSGSNPWTLIVPEKYTEASMVKLGSGIMPVVVDTHAVVTLDDGSTVIGGSATTPHFIGALDMSFLPVGSLGNNKTLFHITMECGNDALVGRVPDSGSTLALMGAAMSGLAFIGRRARRQS
ncbi:MAG: VPDSG-CTERM sorting domain-containing protein [Verrucomicrobia bacterium]|nr:VPDSG-CTERM sorting domain-containing protein [Verrucomicrobiota bacterium]